MNYPRYKEMRFHEKQYKRYSRKQENIRFKQSEKILTEIYNDISTLQQQRVQKALEYVEGLPKRTT